MGDVLSNSGGQVTEGTWGAIVASVAKSSGEEMSRFV